MSLGAHADMYTTQPVLGALPAAVTAVIGSNILVVTIAARNVTRFWRRVVHPVRDVKCHAWRDAPRVTEVMADLVQIPCGKYRWI